MIACAVSSCSGQSTEQVTVESKMQNIANHPQAEHLQHIVLGGGCFWCIEAVFQRIPGVVEVLPGYAGGTLPDPTYEQVVSGTTGHAEVAKITFDPDQIDLSGILDVFWKAHDPTTLNRQGADVGTQYRSIILYRGDLQKSAALASRDALDQAKAYPDPVVTEIVPLDTFYPAEDYHLEYYNRNPNAGYNRFVIQPKLEKLGLKK